MPLFWESPSCRGITIEDEGGKVKHDAQAGNLAAVMLAGHAVSKLVQGDVNQEHYIDRNDEQWLVKEPIFHSGDDHPEASQVLPVGDDP